MPREYEPRDHVVRVSSAYGVDLIISSNGTQVDLEMNGENGTFDVRDIAEAMDFVTGNYISSRDKEES